MSTETLTKENLNRFLVNRIQQTELVVHSQVQELKPLVDALAKHVLPCVPFLLDKPDLNPQTVQHLTSCIAHIVDRLREQAGILSAKHEIHHGINPTND